MNTTPTLDVVSTAPVDAALPSLNSDRPARSRSAVRGGVLVASFVTAGALFWGVPTVTSQDDLPDPGAMALLGDGRNTSAENVEFWASRVEAVPGSVGFRAQLASAQLALAGDTGDLAGYGVAEQTALAAVELAPTDQRALLVLASARAGQHDFAGALDLTEQVVAADPTSVAALLAAGDARLELGDYAGARTTYDGVAALVGGKAAVLSRFARLESLTGSLAESEALARRALVEAGDIDLRHADAAFYWFQLATFEYHQGDYDSAAEHARTALVIDPHNLGSTELLARVLVARGDHADATAMYEQLISGGGAADLHGELAKLYAASGRQGEAAEQVELGLAVAAQNADRYPAERRHLIGFLVDHDPDEALRLAELDLADRQDILSHAWYAWSLHQVGRFDAAAIAMQPAIAYGTQDAWLLYQAGVIAADVGNAQMATVHLTAALDLNPEFDLVHAERARVLLATL